MTRHPSEGQLPLPLLELDDVVAIDAAVGVVEHQAKKHLMAGKHADAERVFGIADDLRRILERHAAIYRANNPAHRPTPSASTALGGTADQADISTNRRSENLKPTQ